MQTGYTQGEEAPSAYGTVATTKGFDQEATDPGAINVLKQRDKDETLELELPGGQVYDHQGNLLTPLDEPCCLCHNPAYFRCGAKQLRQCACNKFYGCDRPFCERHCLVLPADDISICHDCSRDFDAYKSRKRWSWRLIIIAIIIAAIVPSVLIGAESTEEAPAGAPILTPAGGGSNQLDQQGGGS